MWGTVGCGGGSWRRAGAAAMGGWLVWTSLDVAGGAGRGGWAGLGG